MPDFIHDAPETLRLGLVIADGVAPDASPVELDRRLAEVLERRSGPLPDAEDAFRKEVRDIFRNGSYKPTGRGKPASEYLLRAAAEDRFPRINAVVDVCNYMSLKTLYPISVWDPDRTEGDIYRFRLGREDEEYVFNASGQSISLRDLIVGCVCTDDTDPGAPIVNAVRDSQQTKTTPESSRIIAAIYAPDTESPVQKLAEAAAEFAHLLADPSVGGTSAHGILTPGGRSHLDG